MCKTALKMNHVIDVVTNIVNFIRARGLNHSTLEYSETDHGDTGYHTAVRWFSQGKVLKRMWNLRADILVLSFVRGKARISHSSQVWA